MIAIMSKLEILMSIIPNFIIKIEILLFFTIHHVVLYNGNETLIFISNLSYVKYRISFSKFTDRVFPHALCENSDANVRVQIRIH